MAFANRPCQMLRWNRGVIQIATRWIESSSIPSTSIQRPRSFTSRPAFHLSRRDTHTSSATLFKFTLRPRLASTGQHSLGHAVTQSSRWNSNVGAEPGIDTSITRHKSDGTAERPAESQIEVIDFSDEQIDKQSISSSSLSDFLETQSKPDWAACRWVHVNGLNPEVVKTIGRAKGLHRLAIEDVLDTTTSAKVDWYDDHCYMEMPLQKLVRREVKQDTGNAPEVTLRDASRRRVLSRNLAMTVEQVSIFLTADNTVVTFFEQSGEDVLKPILTRLEARETLVRSSNDPWMLIQAVIDAVVDLSLPIGKAVDDVFGGLESAVLTSPAIAQSRAIYVLRSGLTLLLNNTNAINGLVKTLIDHRNITAPQAPTSMSISAVTQVYLQDVQDHITTLSNNTRMSIRSAENLTSLIFNMIAASQNESVRQLTLISSFFLPLTFLTGYFGMNFDPMPVVNDHSDAFFWVIAAPVMLTTLALLGLRSTWLRSLIWRRRYGRKT